MKKAGPAVRQIPTGKNPSHRFDDSKRRVGLARGNIHRRGGDQNRNSEAPGQFTASGHLTILSFRRPGLEEPQAAFNFRLSGRSAHDAMITAPITTGVTM
jgi:hypothetical protein